MQIVINLPDSTTKELLETDYENGSLFDQVLRSALKKAVILPKGCGTKRQFESDLTILDKIKTEVDRQHKWLLRAGCYNTYNVDIAFSAIKSVVTERKDTK